MPSIARRANIRRDEPTPACHAGSTMMRAESHESGRSVCSSHLLTSLLPRSGSLRPPASASCNPAFVLFVLYEARPRAPGTPCSAGLGAGKSLLSRLTVAVLCRGSWPWLFYTVVAVALRPGAETSAHGACCRHSAKLMPSVEYRTAAYKAPDRGARASKEVTSLRVTGWTFL